MSPVFRPHEPQTGTQLGEEKIVLQKRGKRGRPRKAKSKQRRALEAMSPRWQDFEAGRLKVEDLDWEELQRGQLRNKNGTFSGGKPAILPRAWHDELAKRAVEHGQDVLTRNIDIAVNSLVDIAKSGPARERVQASIYITDRVMGLMTQKTESKSEVTIFQDAIAGGEFLVDLGEDAPLELEPLDADEE